MTTTTTTTVRGTSRIYMTIESVIEMSVGEDRDVVIGEWREGVKEDIQKLVRSDGCYPNVTIEVVPDAC